MNDNRFVIDTNVLISAVVFRSKNPDMVLKKCLSTGKAMLSEEIAVEYRTRLLGKKFDAFVPRQIREKILTLFIDSCEWAEPDKTIRASRDANDNKFLELAVHTQASCIVAGDKDLLVLHPFENILILSPKDFLEKL